ncbi:hypothetical protein LIER_22185 [Lithospermum erythrorhizon]|uniref:Polyprotein n=1 Tax=Lithospermum erythrorhizon TaxID=34254 RepID=A0AAV3QU74_LITER
MKEECDWTKEEHKRALHNSKALKAILGWVDQKMFKLINMCTTAKEAWKILETTHEEVVKTEKVAAKISETLVDESVTLCVSNTMKTTVSLPNANDTCVLRNTLSTREACTLETTDVSRNVVPTVVQHVANEVHKKNNPIEDIMHTRMLRTLLRKFPDVVPPDAHAMHASDPIMKDVVKDVTTCIVSNDDIVVGNSGVEDTLNDVETEMHIPNYTAQEKKKWSKKRMHKGGDKENFDAI